MGALKREFSKFYCCYSKVNIVGHFRKSCALFDFWLNLNLTLVEAQIYSKNQWQTLDTVSQFFNSLIEYDIMTGIMKYVVEVEPDSETRNICMRVMILAVEVGMQAEKIYTLFVQICK